MTEPTQENILTTATTSTSFRRHVRDESVDLVYLDPPFDSNQNYNVLFAEQDGDRSAAQIKAFGHLALGPGRLGRVEGMNSVTLIGTVAERRGDSAFVLAVDRTRPGPISSRSHGAAER
ncbi:MAG: hypothetical protein H0V94_02570 [Actinobacteria bacterium]|nr:hypothetical protein [Actinomycetota bacterium]